MLCMMIHSACRLKSTMYSYGGKEINREDVDFHWLHTVTCSVQRSYTKIVRGEREGLGTRLTCSYGRVHCPVNTALVLRFLDLVPRWLTAVE